MNNQQAAVPDGFPSVIRLGYYSNSQNGVIISALGITPCICGGGRGHDSDVPKILIAY